MRIVAAAEVHLPACFDVWVANEDFHRPPGVSVFPLHRHELRTGTLLLAAEPMGGEAGDPDPDRDPTSDPDGGLVWADDPTGGITLDSAAGPEVVVGFGAVLERSGVSYLADLFVWPDRQGRGIGRALMQSLYMERRGPRFTIATSHPAGRRLYRHFGMFPDWYLSTVVVPVGAAASPRLASHLEARPVPVDEVLTLDRAVTHRDRRVDLEFEVDAEAGAAGEILGLYDSGLRRPVGYGVLVTRRPWDADPHRARLGPVVLAEPELAAPAYGALLAAAAARGVTSVLTFVPTEHPVRPMLEAAGGREAARDLVMASESGLLDPRRYFPAPGTA